MRDVAFVVPVYNEAEVIGGVIDTLLAVTPHVVCVNDGSADGSAAEILRAGAYLVDHPVNMGQGAALHTGIEFARVLPGVQRFVTFDADGQHSVDDAVRLLTTLEAGDLDIVLGSRFLGASVGASRWTERGGGRIWLDALAGTRLGRMVGVSAGPIVELDDLHHPRLGASVGLWAFLGVTPYARVGTVEDLGAFAEIGVHIALPVRRWRR